MMSSGSIHSFPPFAPDLSALVWPMHADDFLAHAMQAKVLFQRGDRTRLALLDPALGHCDLHYLLGHGSETTIWKEGGLAVTRGTDSAHDAAALVPGVTIQTHLQATLPFARRFISTLSRAMHLEEGFFSIFASQDAFTATHYDRNYNFTIQLRGEKTWTVHCAAPAIFAPGDCVALDSDRLARMSPEMHAAPYRPPAGAPARYTLAPGDMLYIPPGYWHATECDGLSIQLNLSIAPCPWSKVVGDRLLRHLQTQQHWREPFGVPTRSGAAAYLARLRQLVDALSPEDLQGARDGPGLVRPDQPLRRTLGSLLTWDRNGAGVHFAPDEVRFAALGPRGRLNDLLPAAMEPVLMALAALEQPRTAQELAAECGAGIGETAALAMRLLDLGYLTVAGPGLPDSAIHPVQTSHP